MQEWIDAQIHRVHNSDASDVQQLYRRSLILEPREAPQPRPVAIEAAAPPPALPITQKIDLFAWAHAFKQQSTPTTPN